MRKMHGSIFIFFFSSLVLNCSSSISTGHWISDFRAAKQLKVTDNVIEENNDTSFFEGLLENDTISTNDSDILFWTVPNTNETTEDSSIPQMDDKEMMFEDANDKVKAEEEKEPKDTVFTNTKPDEIEEVNEKIVLQRMNCHLEIPIQSTHDLKIQIKFGKLQNNTSGKCCVTLNGPENTQLAILVSDIHLYQNGSEGEVLQMIIANRGSSYILKEYRHQSEYQPLLLTETHKVYLILHYKVTTISANVDPSHFNLEVLTYHKYEKQPKAGSDETHYIFHDTRRKNLDKFYLLESFDLIKRNFPLFFE